MQERSEKGQFGRQALPSEGLRYREDDSDSDSVWMTEAALGLMPTSRTGGWGSTSLHCLRSAEL